MEDRYYDEKEYYRCAIKLRHTDYFSAILHVRSMMQERPLATGQIYECPYCEGLHVTSGRGHKDYSRLQQSLEHLEKVRSHPSYAEKAPSWIQAKDTQMMADIRTRLLELEDKRKSREVNPGSLNKSLPVD
jgi:hypothetical protein